MLYAVLSRAISFLWVDYQRDIWYWEVVGAWPIFISGLTRARRAVETWKTKEREVRTGRSQGGGPRAWENQRRGNSCFSVLLADNLRRLTFTSYIVIICFCVLNHKRRYVSTHTGRAPFLVVSLFCSQTTSAG